MKGEIKCRWKLGLTGIFADEITIAENLLFKSQKLIVPKSLRKEMLAIIHESHLGINKCKSRARDCQFWIGMAKDVEQTVVSCTVCAQNQNANAKGPLMPIEVPDRPWSHIACDIMELKNRHYLVTVDRYSKWIELNLLEDMTSRNTIKHLKSQFSRYGMPDVFYSDNQSNFVSQEFKDFAKDYGFNCVTSSPTISNSNGLAERAVQTVKNLLRKASDPWKAMLNYRSTVIDDIGLSPAQMFFNRKLKTTLPISSPLLEYDTLPKNLRKQMKSRQKKQKHYNDRGSKPLKPLHPGDKVVMRYKDTWTPATVKEKHEAPRSYVVENSYGQTYRCNRKHLRQTKANFPSEMLDTEISIPSSSSSSSQTRNNDSQVQQHAGESADSSATAGRTITETTDTSTPTSSYKTRSGRSVIML